MIIKPIRPQDGRSLIKICEEDDDDDELLIHDITNENLKNIYILELVCK